MGSPATNKHRYPQAVAIILKDIEDMLGILDILKLWKDYVREAFYII